MKTTTLLSLLILAMLLDVAFSFVSIAPQQTKDASLIGIREIPAPMTTRRLELFGMAASPKTTNTNTKTKKEIKVTVNGKPVPSARPGQTILAVAAKAGVKIPTYCKRGACGTCVCYLNYKKVHACKEKLPSGRAEIQTM
jgi:ferredoxin